MPKGRAKANAKNARGKASAARSRASSKMVEEEARGCCTR